MSRKAPPTPSMRWWNWSVPPSRISAVRSGSARFVGVSQKVAGTYSMEEPSSAAWLKRASQMKYGVKVLQRAKKSGVAEDQDLWLKQLDALLALELPEQQNDGVAVRSMVTGAAALEQFQEMKQMAPQLRSLRPSAALYSCGAVGVALRLRRSDATEVEPWLLLVEHVSTSYVDTASAALYLDANQILHDDAGEVAPDVAVLAMEPADFYKWFRTSEMYKSYLAMVFTRNPLGQVPGQAYALPVILWVKTAELLISRAPKSSSQRDPSDAIPSEEAQWFRAMLRIHLTAAETVRQMTQSRGATSELAEALAGPDPSAALTEAEGGPQSVCLALAACCFAPSALRNFWGQRGLELARSRSLQRAHSKTLQRGEEDDRAGWPKRLRRLALAMMAEAVSRACRRLVRSVCLSSNEAEGEVLKKLLWNALGLDQSSVAPVSALGEPDDPKLAKPEGHSDECDVVIAQRKSALLFAPQGKYFQVALTNCTPQGVVGTLMLHMAMLQGTLDPSSDQAVELLMKQLWTREIFMKAFVEAVLPGEVSPGSVQAALYVQGLRYHSAKQRRGGLAPLSAPEQILHTLAREQRHLAYLEQLRAKLASQSSGARKAARSAKRQVELSTFAPAHAGLPRRFTPKEISDLNVCREASDQLELLPNGLLCHHCCFPSCPRYLCDLRTEKDKLAQASEAVGRNAVLASRRNGLFRHLAPMMYPEAQGEDVYIPQLHAGIQYALQRGGGKEGFKKNLRDLLKKRLRPPATEVLHSQWLEEALDRCFDEAPR
ncbi:Hypothetical protein SCF082_LOCUS1669 [Durusdinium trenchii]|uniref:Uncharacterized protein n=1 Tax=Durusdinium trenchii TaxID=1381693 RepID=A0ABP0HG52_9DINO